MRAAVLAGLLLVSTAAAAQPALARNHRSYHRQPDLDLRLAGSPPAVNVGQQVTYTATISNHGSGDARTAAFLDYLPARTTLVSASPSQGTCGGSRVVLCNLGRLPAHAQATVNIVVTANGAGTVLDRGWVGNSRPRHWHDGRTVVTHVSNGGAGTDLDLHLSGSPSSVAAGQQVVYTAAIVNRGPNPVPNAAFQDIIPPSTTLVSANTSQGSCSGNPTLVCTLGSIGAGATATATITVATTRAGTFFDRAWVSTSPPGNWRHGHLVVTRVFNAQPDLDLQLSGSPSSVTAGQQVTYTATITNRGSGAATTAAFQNLIPAKTTLVSASASQGSCGGNSTIVCSLGSLAQNASATVTVVVATTEPGPLVDRGWISTNPPGDWRHERDVHTNVIAAVADLDLQLAGSAPVVNAGQQVVYTATIANHGTAAVANAAFQDQLPANVTLSSATSSQGSCTGNPTLLCSLGPIAPNASATVTITITTTQGGAIHDRGWVSANPPGNWQHQRDVVTQVRNVSPDLDFHLVGSPTSVTAGQNITYTAVIGNHGSGAANAAFQDQLPGNVTLVSATSTQGSCTGSPTLVCTLGALAPGATATVTITVTTTAHGAAVDRGWVSDNPPGNWQHERDVVTDLH
jgi:uncharacterized repeat protein (TIGR01451 family)